MLSKRTSHISTLKNELKGLKCPGGNSDHTIPEHTRDNDMYAHVPTDSVHCNSNTVDMETDTLSIEIDMKLVHQNQYDNNLDPTTTIPHETSPIVEDILSVNDSISTTSDDTTNQDFINHEFDMENNYAMLNENSNKVISFLNLKKEVENGLLCKKCICENGISAFGCSTLSVRQETFGIATVLKISCGNHHIIEIIPERIDKNLPKHHASNFMINYKLLILMQFLGKGIKSITVITALLGMRVSLGFYPIWKKC